MILQELVRYYDRNRDHLAIPGFEDNRIAFVITLRANGSPVQIEDYRDHSGRQPVGRIERVPRSVDRPGQGAWSIAFLLWDHPRYVLGVPKDDTDKEVKLAPMRVDSFRKAILDAFPERPRDAGVQAVLNFYGNGGLLSIRSLPNYDEASTGNGNISFKLVGDTDLVPQRLSAIGAIQALALAEDSAATKATCLITGEQAPPERLHSATPIRGTQSTAKIHSFNLDAFNSFAKTQGQNAAISKQAAFAYTTALNHLITSRRNSTGFGELMTMLFWADKDSRFDSEFTLADFFGEPAKDDPDRGVRAVQALLESVQAGRLPVGDADTRFFVLGLAPNAARISVRFWLQAPLSELAPRILRHFADLRVARRFDSDRLTPSLFRLLSSLAVQGKLDNVPPRLAGEWMRAILEGQPYPMVLLNAAVIRCKADQEVSYLRACVLKAWLNREHRRTHPDADTDHQHFKEALDMDQPDTAYRLGRLFAVLERVQESAQPGINATIRDRYYGAASTTPVAVFTTLLRLKNAHLKKLPERQAGYFEKMIGEVLAPLTEFPRQLALPDQGRFALGYYHQRQSFFVRRNDDIETLQED